MDRFSTLFLYQICMSLGKICDKNEQDTLDFEILPLSESEGGHDSVCAVVSYKPVPQIAHACDNIQVKVYI